MMLLMMKFRLEKTSWTDSGVEVNKVNYSITKPVNILTAGSSSNESLT